MWVGVGVTLRWWPASGGQGCLLSVQKTLYSVGPLFGLLVEVASDILIFARGGIHQSNWLLLLFLISYHYDGTKLQNICEFKIRLVWSKIIGKLHNMLLIKRDFGFIEALRKWKKNSVGQHSLLTWPKCASGQFFWRLWPRTAFVGMDIFSFAGWWVRSGLAGYWPPQLSFIHGELVVYHVWWCW